MSGRRRRVSFFVHDLASNPLGRALPLARALASDWDVEIIGLLLSGDRVYGPYEGLWPYRAMRSSPDVGAVLRRLPALARLATGDVICACKPLLTTLGPALLASGFGRRRPLVLDAEDDEWVPMGRTPAAVLWRDVIKGWRHATAWKYTMALHPFTRRASEVWVSSAHLQRRYGGRIVLHGPDATTFDPTRRDLDAAGVRARFGMPADVPLVLFSGTPRPHKGMAVLVEALRTAPAAGWHLLLGGAADDPDAQAARAALGARCHLAGTTSYDAQPALLAAATAVVVPQLPVAFARSQVSAKALDALAMACPLVTSDTGDFPGLLAPAGEPPRGWVVPAGDAAALAETLARLVREPGEARARAARGRAWFVAHASMQANRRRLGEALTAIVEAHG